LALLAFIIGSIICPQERVRDLSREANFGNHASSCSYLQLNRLDAGPALKIELRRCDGQLWHPNPSISLPQHNAIVADLPKKP